MPTLETIEALAKRRGFFWVSSEIYGGFAGFYDYGPMGTLLKRNVEDAWRSYFLGLNPNFFEIDTTTVMPEKVFVASGHSANFIDPVARCKKCGTQHRADHIVSEFLKENFEGMTPLELTELIKQHKIRCPKCKGELEEVSVLNMMFPVNAGGAKAFLRPETAQGAYVNFLQNYDVLRKKLPMGLAIVGRVYRNEISPRQLTMRTREFTQAELQIFFNPAKLDEHESWGDVKGYKLLLKPVAEKKLVEVSCSDAAKKYGMPKFYVYHMAKVQQFMIDIVGIPKARFRFRELSEEERAFYNKMHWDVEVDIEALGGFKEVGGVHYRSDHDLTGHAKLSGKSHEVLSEDKKVLPHVLELTVGIDRIILALLDTAYATDKDRVYLKLKPNLSPFAVAVFPLLNKDGLPEKAFEIYKCLRYCFRAMYDDSGSIGKRYYRQDEVGTAFCITIDHQTLEDQTVTVRERDTTKQERVKIDRLIETIGSKMSK